MANVRQGEELEKYYTPKEFTNYILDRYEKMTKWRPSTFLEPTAGNGRIIDVLKDRYDIPIEAYDIHNEDHREDIVEVDYNKLKLGYKKGRMTVANYPFQVGKKMLEKSILESDFVVAITGINTIINFEYDKFEDKYFFHKILVKKKLKFDRVEVGCAVYFIQRKDCIPPDELEELKKRIDWI